MTDNAPPLIRPIPRRPFNRSGSNDDDVDGSPSLAGADISRPPSTRNLTASTLSGIFSPATPGADEDGDRTFDVAVTVTPGTRTPLRRPSIDDVTYELMKRRSHPQRGRAYSTVTVDADRVGRSRHPRSGGGGGGSGGGVSAASLAVRCGLLFTLGLGFGVVLARFEKGAGSAADAGAAAAAADKVDHARRNLVFWGVSGVVLGGAMPTFDRIWAATLGASVADGKRHDGSSAVVDGDDDDDDDDDDGDQKDRGALAGVGGRTTDLAMILRPIGVFMGIVFAIRRLAWDSTLQVAFTLASVNPLLWWLIDRSAVGLVLSAAVGVVGSVVLLGTDPDMMPVPSASLDVLRGGDGRIGATGNHSAGTAAAAAAAAARGVDAFPLAAIVSQETVEAGAWMLSVLFCSSLCFGNIGRRLAWDKKTVMKSRWVGTR
ncbi:Insulin-induced protein (INSIG) [Geosmithia morbida]|uniref:Insulin-induced protein (INSIG) n=1 Tax=Geosmithia morbida TaxID=1094350 RepID=A0A9P5D0W9_9HYPO|nr:Insulin-induced protein (INSIG) [Geosmithia morbida]KAF4123198.1 Insulin-induced protein (INSIG) [Geosmithia morbida]